MSRARALDAWFAHALGPTRNHPLSPPLVETAENRSLWVLPRRQAGGSSYNQEEAGAVRQRSECASERRKGRRSDAEQRATMSKRDERTQSGGSTNAKCAERTQPGDASYAKCAERTQPDDASYAKCAERTQPVSARRPTK